MARIADAFIGKRPTKVEDVVAKAPEPRSEQEQWLAEATNSSKLGASTSGAIAALLAVVSAVKGMPSGVAIAVVVVAGVAIVASGAIVMTDLWVRGRVKVAQLGKGPTAGTANVPPAADTVAASDPTAPAEWHPINVPMAITFSGGSDRWGVVALRSEADGSSSFLAGRSGRTLRVVPETELDETFYESNPGQFEPRVGA